MYRHVKKSIAADWFDVGVELFDENDVSELSTIKSSYAGNAEGCCAEMLRVWHKKYPKVTWNEFIKALRAPGLELNDTASKLEEMLQSSEPCM